MTNGFRLKVFTVTEVTERIQRLLSSDPVLRRLTVSGEVSNCSKRYDSGTIYFVLKDEQASIKVLYRGPGTLQDGMKIRASGNIALYRARGEYQLYADLIEEDGQGDLHIRFERLKRELETAGYFSPESKQPLPSAIQRVGIVTSQHGAALQDVLTVFRKRDAIHDTIICDARVQGIGAAEQIRDAIAYFNERCPVDVLIVTRGGGSLEDLWPFNERVVVETIRASRIPVLSGVGHEVDTTLTDLVADERAATPTAAAERISDITARRRYRERIERGGQMLPASVRERLDRLRERLLRSAPQAAEQLVQRHVELCLHRLSEYRARCHDAIERQIEGRCAMLAQNGELLHALSPLQTLDRGYAVVEPGKPLREYEVGEQLKIRLKDGTLTAHVAAVSPGCEHTGIAAGDLSGEQSGRNR